MNNYDNNEYENDTEEKQKFYRQFSREKKDG